MSRMLIVLALLLVACGQVTESMVGRDQATVTDSAGITIVQNHRPVWGEGEGWRVSAEPVVVVPDSIALGSGSYVMQVARLASGDLLVLSEAGGRWLDASGNLRRPFASQGDGPGEFRYTNFLLVLAGDTVVVGSSGVRGKLAFLGPDGILVREVFADVGKRQALGRWAECLSYLLPDLSTTGCQADPTIPESPTNRRMYDDDGRYTGPGPGLLRSLRRTYRISPAFDSLHPLGLDIGIEQQTIVLPGGHATSLVHPYHARSYLAHGGTPTRIAIATNPHWEIELWTLDGRLTHRIRRDGGRRIPTAGERREAEERVDDPNSYVIREEPGATRQELRAMLQWPDSLPGHSGLVMTADGMMLSRQAPTWVRSAPSAFDVIDMSGRWLGTIRLPAGFRLHAAGEDYLLGVQFDEDDVPSVVVYGLERGAGG